MVLEEYVVLVRSPLGNNQRQFTYWVDPHKKPNIRSVLKDFKSNAQIQNIDQWKLCTLGGSEIRFLADYADRILVLTPITPPGPKLPSIRTAASFSSGVSSSTDDDSNKIERKSRNLSKSSSTLPSLSPTEHHISTIRMKRSKSIDNTFVNRRRSRRNRSEFAEDVENSRERTKHFAVGNRRPKENKLI